MLDKGVELLNTKNTHSNTIFISADQHEANFTNINTAIQEAHDQAIKSLNIDRQQAEQLEEYLNNIMAAQDNDDNAKKKQQIFHIIQNYYKQVYDIEFDEKAIKNLDDLFSQKTIKIKSDNTKLLRDYKPKPHKKYIHINTLVNNYKDISRKLAEIRNGHFELEEIKNVQKNMEKLRDKLKEALRFMTKDYSKNLISLMQQNITQNLNEDNDFKKLIDEIDTLLLACTTINQLDNAAIGQTWETTLKLLSTSGQDIIENLEDNTINHTKEDFIAGISTEGTQTVSGGNIAKSKNSGDALGLQLDTHVSIVKLKSNSSNKQKKEQKKISIPAGDNQFITVDYHSTYNPNADGRQGKVDVKASFPLGVNGKTLPTDFRISAKNWNTADRDFGETQLPYAIHRTHNEDILKAYIYTLGDFDDVVTSNMINRAHALARQAVLLDTIMGYSQSQAKNQTHADTLVINVRQGNKKHQIKVYSIKSLINNAKACNFDYQVQGYNEDTVRKDLSEIAFAAKQETLETFYNRGRTYLQSILVSMHYSQIQKLYAKKT